YMGATFPHTEGMPPMATALDIAKLNTNAAPLTVADAARTAGIEKIADLTAAANTGLSRLSLVGLTRLELKDKLAQIGVPEREHKMRVSQLWHWIYLRGATSFHVVTNETKGLRSAL